MTQARVSRRGSCLCGAVRYRVDAEPAGINYCHCRQCRKATGSAFATNAAFARSALHFEQGEAALRAYESSPGKRRHFCATCGTPVFSHYEAAPEVVYVRIGSLDDDEALQPDVHIHTASKAPWYALPDDGLPRRDAQEALWF